MIAITRLSPRDWEQLRAVRLRALGESPDAFAMTLEEEETFPDELWRKRLESAATFIATHREEGIGIATGATHPQQSGAAILVGMWVAPSARRTGIASRLVARVIDWARGEGFERLLLDVANDNAAAIDLYERMGFVPTGHTGHLPAPREHILEHERALSLSA